jgi:membrane peptidoglycan carboxypeptidase
LYLNDVPYGGTLYGAEAAARAFYGKSAKDVDLAQAAYLAGMPQSPTFYSPYGNNRAALDTRKNLVLARMKELGYITADEYANAKAEVVTFRPQQYGTIIAPHFVFFIRQYLEQKYGADVVTQGLTVQTTLDAELQQDAESIVSQYGASNVGKFHANNAALVAIDPKTGQILAMVGSRDYFNTDIQGNYNIALASRQPGSAFKPFVYAAALQKGYTPQTAVFDVPTQFSTACAPSDVYNDTPPCYAPQNYDNKFRGAMTFATALAQSINVPAVKVLYLAGIKNVIALAQSAGIDTLGDANHYGLTLALGAAEVPLLKLTNAYGVFADNGVYNPPVGILKVTDSRGNVLEEYQPQPSAVLDPGVAHDVTYMLSNNDARQPEYPPVNPFYFPGHDVAAKTGTTNDSRDAWTVGYTPNIVVGTWAGNNDNTPMVKEIAGYIVAPMWNAFMQKAIAKYPVEYFEAPRAVSETAPAILRGNYMSGGVPHDILFWVNKDNPQSGGSSTGDAQYPYWEYSVGGWAGSGTVSVPGAPTTNNNATTTP